MTNFRYRTQRQRIGVLDCTVVKSDLPPAAVAVLCHGFGAPGDDLAGLATDLLEARSGSAPVELIFPAGLLSLADEGFAEGRAWWRLSIQRLIQALEQGQFEQVRRENPPGIDQAREALTEVVSSSLARTGLDSRKLLLGGFSQGAMLSMECACCGLDAAPGAMAIYSGCLIREDSWKPQVAKLADTRIVQSHGQFDSILPLAAGVWLRDLLVSEGCQVEFLQFQGPHTISWEAIERTARLLDELTGE